VKSYRSHKLVQAAAIGAILPPGSDGNYTLALDGDETEAVPATWMERHRPEIGGYFVRYPDGYTSYSPAQAFEGGYGEIGAQVDLEDAIAAKVAVERANLGLATNAEIEAEMEARRSMGHTAPDYRTVD
jgi:hypothetical protein